jgi:hypothetical protein
VRKLIALLVLFLTLILPSTTFAAQIHFDSLTIEEGLFEKQSFDQQRNQLLNELINQLHLYEQYFGASKIAPGIKVVMSGNNMPDFNPDKPLISRNTIYLIQTSDDQSFLSKFNTIFEQLLYLNYPKADKDAVSIISTFLKYKYFNVNISKIAGLYRFCFPNQNLHQDPLKSDYDDSFSQAVMMLAASKLNEIDMQAYTDFNSFLKTCLNEGFIKACPKFFMDFPSFIRSVKTGLPNMKTVDVLIEAEERRSILMSGMHIKPSRQDVQIRLDSFKDLDHALLFIAQGDNVKSKLMLDRVDIQLAKIASVENFWWLIFSLMVLAMMACFLYIHNRLILRNVVDSTQIKLAIKEQNKFENKKEKHISQVKPEPIIIDKPEKIPTEQVIIPDILTMEIDQEQTEDRISKSKTKKTDLESITSVQPEAPKLKRKKAETEQSQKNKTTKKSASKQSTSSKTTKKTDTKRKTSK